MTILLETERLYLRTLTEDDAAFFFKLNSNPNVIKYTGDAAFSSIKQAKLFLKNYEDYQRNNYGRWAVMLKSTNTTIGWCGLRYDNKSQETDIGFRFFEAYWNKGYATESAKACLDYGFKTIGLKRIIGRAMIQNKASLHLLQKLGMQFVKHITLANQPAMLLEIKSPY